MKIAIAGVSGFLGGAIRAELRAAGHTALGIGRRSVSEPPDILWNPSRGELDSAALDGVDAVVNLAGASIAQRWTQQSRKEIVDSRVQSTTLLAKTIAALRDKPRVFVSASAVGFYGDAQDREVDESSPRGTGFLADVAQVWESSADAARKAGVRVVHARFGVALNPHGGALAKMLPVFKLGAGGRIGSGRQWIAWVALTDVARAVRFIIEQDALGCERVGAQSGAERRVHACARLESQTARVRGGSRVRDQAGLWRNGGRDPSWRAACCSSTSPRCRFPLRASGD
jgi:uncharacterized protein